jgi:hypothetical protein
MSPTDAVMLFAVRQDPGQTVTGIIYGDKDRCLSFTTDNNVDLVFDLVRDQAMRAADNDALEKAWSDPVLRVRVQTHLPPGRPFASAAHVWIFLNEKYEKERQLLADTKFIQPAGGPADRLAQLFLDIMYLRTNPTGLELVPKIKEFLPAVACQGIGPIDVDSQVVEKVQTTHPGGLTALCGQPLELAAQAIGEATALAQIQTLSEKTTEL